MFIQITYNQNNRYNILKFLTENNQYYCLCHHALYVELSEELITYLKLKYQIEIYQYK